MRYLCSKCGAVWRPEDYGRERCPFCRLKKLEEDAKVPKCTFTERERRYDRP